MTDFIVRSILWLKIWKTTFEDKVGKALRIFQFFIVAGHWIRLNIIPTEIIVKLVLICIQFYQIGIASVVLIKG